MMKSTGTPFEVPCGMPKSMSQTCSPSSESNAPRQQIGGERVEDPTDSIVATRRRAATRSGESRGDTVFPDRIRQCPLASTPCPFDLVVLGFSRGPCRWAVSSTPARAKYAAFDRQAANPHPILVNRNNGALPEFIPTTTESRCHKCRYRFSSKAFNSNSDDRGTGGAGKG